MRLRFSLSLLLLLSACRDRPSREDALQAFRAAQPGIDSAPAIVRVWADGPPWFSCAEVIAKLKSTADRAVVRDQLGQWRALVVANWVTLHDTAAGDVVEPGWCTASLHDEPKRLTTGWSSVSGGPRRGWDVVVGTRQVQVPGRTKLVGRDSARASFVITIVPNENGVAAGADRDTVVKTALLEKVDGRWRLVR